MIRLELERRRRQLSQRQLGEEILYSHQLISDLERGYRPPDKAGRRVRAALEAYFKIPFCELMEDVEKWAKDVESARIGTGHV